MKYSLIAILLIGSLLGFGGCTATKETTGEEQADITPQLTVTVGKENIESVSLINSEDRYDKDIFKFAFENEEMADIKYVKNDEKITLNFGDTPPDNITVKDILVDSDGACLFSEKFHQDISLKHKGDNFVFYLKDNPYSLLRSDYASLDHVNRQFRGFKITVTWGDKEYIYGFVIKTNII